MMVLERWSDAQTGNEWENKNLCAAIASLLKRENKKKTSTSVVHLQLCHLCVSLVVVFLTAPLLLSPSFVLQSFGSSSSCRSQEADGLVNSRGQIIL